MLWSLQSSNVAVAGGSEALPLLTTLHCYLTHILARLESRNPCLSSNVMKVQQAKMDAAFDKTGKERDTTGKEREGAASKKGGKAPAAASKKGDEDHASFGEEGSAFTADSVEGDFREGDSICTMRESDDGSLKARHARITVVDYEGKSAQFVYASDLEADEALLCEMQKAVVSCAATHLMRLTHSMEA